VLAGYLSGGNDMKKTLLFALILLLSISLFGCINRGDGGQLQNEGLPNEEPYVEADSIVYRNNQYGFRFSLPENGKGYTIETGKWEGFAAEDPENTAETGPMIYIRHPQWTFQNQRQDIPIIIFTKSQWSLLQQEKFHIGAAPVGPRELGRNTNYVFALPARYNYAFPSGYEEVENILENNPLQALDII